jgi:hypothetical protein
VHSLSTECSLFSPEADVGWEVWSCLGDVLAVGWGSDSGCAAREREREVMGCLRGRVGCARGG